MKEYRLENGATLLIENAGRGYADDYKVTYCENGRALWSDYYSAAAIEYDFEITL